MPEALPNTIETYQAAITANPTSAEAHANLGWGFYGQRKYDEAVKAFQQSLTLDRNLTDAHYGLGLALKESGATQQAVSAFEAVVKLAPQDQSWVRGQMLGRLARGHINQIKTGNWGLDADIIHSAP
jgi:tetratricopeptide (TPR) repeat protein